MDKQRKTKLLKIIQDLGYEISDPENVVLHEIGLSSFDQMRFIVEIEEEYDIDIPIDEMDLSNFDTFEKVNKIIQKSLKVTN